MKLGTPEHPKTLALMEAAGISKPLACGYLELLWQFTARYAPQGDVGRWSDHKIENAVGWDGKPGELIANLIKARFLEPSARDRLLVHDWHEHASEWVRKSLRSKGLGFRTASATRSGRKSPMQSRPPGQAVRRGRSLSGREPGGRGDGIGDTVRRGPKTKPPARPDLDKKNGPETKRKAELVSTILAQCGALASEAGIEAGRVIEIASLIPAGNGYAERSFADPRAAGISIDWLEATLRAIPQTRARLLRPIPQ